VPEAGAALVAGHAAAAVVAAQDAALLNTPKWLWSSWEAAYGKAVTRAIAEAHLAEAPLDLTLKDPDLAPEDPGGEKLLQLAALEHLHHDVRPADKLTLHIELGDSRPVAILLDTLADFLVLKDVDGLIFHLETVEDRHGAARKTALRELGLALHEKDDRIAGHGGFNALLNVGRDFS